ncbi:MAG: polysaccharide pyruvyl transferase family protein [Propionibacteriaceae bacterium]|nr:polysaccharide pyruvyl transferase family protein [Propionibacteriaceae bacterium]
MLYDTVVGTARRLVFGLVGLRYSRSSRAKNAAEPPIKLFWWNGEPNFGDRFMVDLIWRLFGYRSEWVGPESCDMIGAGSILDYPVVRLREKEFRVWGSGFIKPDSECPRAGVYHLVRGPLTRSRLPLEYKDIPVGDPGLLANVVYEKARRSGKIGVVPHYVDKELPIVRAMEEDDRFSVIDVAWSPDVVARRISECSLVLSSSLHGLVFADSYGIPNAHIQLSDRLTGGLYKFTDYYASVGRVYENATISKLFDDSYLDSLKKSYVPVRGLFAMQRSLIKSFPYG